MRPCEKMQNASSFVLSCYFATGFAKCAFRAQLIVRDRPSSLSTDPMLENVVTALNSLGIDNQETTCKVCCHQALCFTFCTCLVVLATSTLPQTCILCVVQSREVCSLCSSEVSLNWNCVFYLLRIYAAVCAFGSDIGRHPSMVYPGYGGNASISKCQVMVRFMDVAWYTVDKLLDACWPSTMRSLISLPKIILTRICYSYEATGVW